MPAATTTPPTPDRPKSERRRALRRSLFWIHLALGVVCGAVIALMASTGLLLAFRAEILEFARRDEARVTVPADAGRLPVDRLERALRESTGAAPSAITVWADPAAAVQLATGRDTLHFADPYTGDLREAGGARVAAALKFAEELHRWLALGGDGRAVGKAITGACALAFLLLSLSGLYLWWPRAWNARTLRPSIALRRGAKGRARDWNWHNVFGFWALPVLIVISSSGVVISYRWANNFLYLVAGETPPALRAPAEPARFAPPAPGDRPLSREALLNKAVAEVPGWTSATLRSARARRSAETPARREGASSESAAGALPVSVQVTRSGTIPLFAGVTVTLHPYTGEVLRREGFSDRSVGDRLRAAARYLHTGEGLGLPGKLLAFLGALAALMLVWTGYALTWRRFFRRAENAPSPEVSA